MRAKFKALLFVVLINICGAYAQEESASDIQLPSSPGMSIIGIQTSEISKPGNYTGLYSSLISPLISNNGAIPADLAIEFSPYYLVSRNIIVNDIERTDLYRDLKVSIASTKVEGADSSNFSRVGIGFKTYLMNGDLSYLPNDTTITVGMVNLVKGVKNDVDILSFGELDTADLSNYTKRIQNQIEVISGNPESKSRLKQLKYIKREVSKILKSNKSNKSNKSKASLELESLQKKFERLVMGNSLIWNNTLRTGGILELAGALAVDFPNNHINFSKVNRWGVWFNYTYRPRVSKNIDFGSILRVSNYSLDPTVILENEAVFGDLGVSCTFKIPNSKFSFSGEFIGKYGFSELKTLGDDVFTKVTENKWNFTFGYQANDNTIFTMSLSDINGNSDYLRDSATQLLVGINAALSPLKK